ncbi:TPA: hypothetical protein ENG04_08375 [Candidatus Poribacteria bacterium]|nr:hypothetical protein [Candidatus Poribacteria bacterium]HEX30080.1 hypothetical protein [Candidatus Poribacteria bacterium]
MTSYEIIRRVLEFDGPERIGMNFSGGRMNDLVGAGPSRDPDWQPRKVKPIKGAEAWEDEWGCVWERLDGFSKGEVSWGPLQEGWERLEDYRFPTLDKKSRYERAAQVFKANPHMYKLGSLPGFPFNIMRKLRRMDNFLMDVVLHKDEVRELSDKVTDLLMKMIDIYADIGADGVSFAEDWGTQDRLLVSPPIWRELFKPDFVKLVSFAHERGLTVWMHSCGYIYEIIEDLIELGMDVLQFDQPALYGIERLGREFGGRITFWCPVDIQTTLQTGDKDKIQREALRLIWELGRFNGGFIAKNYPSLEAIGVKPEWDMWAYEAFLAHRHYPLEEHIDPSMFKSEESMAA